MRSTLSFLGTLRKMPKTTGNFNRQTITQLPGEHDNLPAMMAFMRDEIRQDMRHVEWKITPGVRRSRRDRAPVVQTELEQTDNAAAAVAKGANEFL